jgi:hypothetical protein
MPTKAVLKPEFLNVLSFLFSSLVSFLAPYPLDSGVGTRRNR